jgi:menaquinone-dependent protoporphyrinogen oxidase
VNVLITAASKHGSTSEIAEAIGRALAAAGVANDVREIEDVTDMTAYDAVVLGSAVYMGSWMDAALTFAAHHSASLTARPVWLFSSGPIGDPPHPSREHAVEIAEVMATTGAREHRLFAGRLDRHSLTFGERALVRAVRATEGDYRDWDDVTTWANTIAVALLESDTSTRRVDSLTVGDPGTVASRGRTG